MMISIGMAILEMGDIFFPIATTGERYFVWYILL